MTQLEESPSGRVTDDRRGLLGRRRVWLLISALVVVALAVAGGLWWRWLYSAHALHDGILAGLGTPAVPGETLYSLPMVIPDGRKPVTLDIRSVTPRVSVNTANAKVRPMVCLRNDATSTAGVVAAQMPCQWIHPFAPGRITIDHDEPGTMMIYVAVTAAQPGQVLVNGVHVDYRQGWRHGSQDTGNDFKMVVKRSRQG